MSIADERTLQFLELLKARQEVRFDTEFCEAIGLKKQNLQKIKTRGAENHFTAEQLRKVGEVYNANMNYLYGFSSDPFLDKNRAKKQTESKQNT